MKKILLLAAFVAFGLTSCNKDDDSSNNSSASIEGSWEHSKTGMKVSGQETLVDYSNDCSTSKDYVKINTGGTVDDHWYDVDCAEVVSNGTWSKNGNSLTISFDGFVQTGTITQLSSTTLKVEYDDQGITMVDVFTRK